MMVFLKEIFGTRKQMEEYKMNKKVYKKVAGVAAVVLCSGCITMSALATGGDPPTAAYDDGPTSNLWLSVVELPSQARLSVTVPVSYGFAVVGTVDSNDTSRVSSEDGTILLSNVRVKVTKPSEAGVSKGEYTITTTGMPQVPFNNYSTDVREEHMSEANPPREGLAVEIKPYIVEEPDTVIGMVTKQHYWKPVGDDPTGDPALFKRYRMGLEGKWFDTKGNISDGKEVYDAFFLSENLPLEAPPDVQTNGWNASGTAKVPSITAFDVDVQVGGTRNQYSQIEQSVKIGVIGWEIIPGELPAAP